MADRTQEIRDWWAANDGKGTQEDLDRWLATSGYTAAEINKALPQLGVADLNAAIKQAQAKQEVADREARRQALREANPGRDAIVSDGVDAPARQQTQMSAIPQAELDAARSKLDPTLANFIDWQQNQINPMTNQRNMDQTMAMGINPYTDERYLQSARETMDRANRRQELRAANGLASDSVAPWEDPQWRQKQEQSEAQERARQEQMARDSAASGFTTGGAQTTVGPAPSPSPASGPSPTNPTPAPAPSQQPGPSQINPQQPGNGGNGGDYNYGWQPTFNNAPRPPQPGVVQQVINRPQQPDTPVSPSGIITSSMLQAPDYSQSYQQLLGYDPYDRYVSNVDKDNQSQRPLTPTTNLFPVYNPAYANPKIPPKG